MVNKQSSGSFTGALNAYNADKVLENATILPAYPEEQKSHSSTDQAF